MRKCRIDDWNIFTQSRTTHCCQEPATMPIYSERYKTFSWETKEWTWREPQIVGYMCPKHAKEFDLLRCTADAIAVNQQSQN